MYVCIFSQLLLTYTNMFVLRIVDNFDIENSIRCRRKKWQPTPVFLPGESQGQRSLVGCCPWGPTELDTTEAT